LLLKQFSVDYQLVNQPIHLEKLLFKNFYREKQPNWFE